MTIPHACALLFVLCIAYNLLIDRTIQRNHQHGLTSLWVVAGVLLVLVVGGAIPTIEPLYWYWSDHVVPLTDGQLAAWLYLRLFAAAGTPMVLGSLWRYLRSL